VEQGCESPLPHLFFQNAGSVFFCRPAMDHQWQSGFTGCRDMNAKTGRLLITWAVLVMIIKSGFTDTDHLGMLGQLNQHVSRYIRLFSGIVRMGTDGAVNLLMGLCNGTYPVELGNPSADRHHQMHTGISRTAQDARQVIRQNVEIEMAMTVNDRIGHQCRQSALSFDMARENASRCRDFGTRFKPAFGAQ